MQNRLTLKPYGVVLLTLGILTMSSASAAVTFLGEWTDFGSQFKREGFHTSFLNGERVGWEAGKGPNHWALVQERGEDRLQVEQDPTSPKKGAVLRVQVLPGDFLGYSGERAEVSYMLGPTGAQYPVTAASGHEVYGVSIKLDPNWQSALHDHTHGHWQWGIVMQLHSPNQSGGPPAFALTATDQFGVSVLGGDLIGSDGRRRDATNLAFSNGALRAGHWVQFMIDVTWAYDTTGSLTVLRRDEGESAFTKILSQNGVPTLQFNSQFPDSKSAANVHYWKAGYYRSISPGVTSRLWLGPIVRGTSFQEVAVAAFGRP